MPHVDFGDSRIAEKPRRRIRRFTGIGNDRVGDASVAIVCANDELTLRKVFGKRIQRTVRLAFPRVDEDRSNLCIGVAIGKRLVR
jgi:hypothetical protein